MKKERFNRKLQYRLRLNENEFKMLETLSNRSMLPMSEILRNGIKTQYESLKRTDNLLKSRD